MEILKIIGLSIGSIIILFTLTKIMGQAVNDKSQTIETSGCGPTTAAMVVSSIRGTITPPEMGDLFVKYRI